MDSTPISVLPPSRTILTILPNLPWRLRRKRAVDAAQISARRGYRDSGGLISSALFCLPDPEPIVPPSSGFKIIVNGPRPKFFYQTLASLVTLQPIFFIILTSETWTVNGLSRVYLYPIKVRDCFFVKEFSRYAVYGLRRKYNQASFSYGFRGGIYCPLIRIFWVCRARRCRGWAGLSTRSWWSLPA